MKIKLVILTITAVALAASADSQAMMRSVRARVAPAVAKAKSAFKLPANIRRHISPNIDDRMAKIKSQYPLPSAPAHRIDPRINQRYEDVSLQLAEQYADIAEQKKHKRQIRYLSPLFFAAGPIGWAFFIPAAAFQDAYSDLLLKRYKKEQLSIEAELEELVKEQNRELKLRDDIQ